MSLHKFIFSPFQINTYVVVDEPTRSCAVVDPGMMSTEEEQALAGFIEKRGLKVTHVINTHMHIDHCCGDAWSLRNLGAPVLAHKADAPLGAGIQAQASMFGLPMKVENAVASQFVEEGDKISVGETTLEVLHVPGHSPGSIVLYNRADGYVVGGDVLFADSIGRTDLPGGNHQQLVNGIKSKLFTLPDDTVVYPGHGPETTIGHERKHNPFIS